MQWFVPKPSEPVEISACRARAVRRVQSGPEKVQNANVKGFAWFRCVQVGEEEGLDPAVEPSARGVPLQLGEGILGGGIAVLKALPPPPPAGSLAVTPQGIQHWHTLANCVSATHGTLSEQGSSSGNTTTIPTNPHPPEPLPWTKRKQQQLLVFKGWQ